MDQSVIFSDIPYTGPERTDNPAYPVFSTIFKGMQSRFWIPENINMADDKAKFDRLPEPARKLFTMNLAWQIFADSDQSENLLYLAQHTNNIEIKRCIVMQAMEESNHSGSYQYVISSMYDNPTAMLNQMEQDVIIAKRRMKSTKVGQIDFGADTDMIGVLPAAKMLALEGVSFTTSFITTLAVDKHFEGGLPGCKAQILKIAADESGHIVLWSNILKILLRQGHIQESEIHSIFKDTIANEIDWVTQLHEIYPIPELEPKRVEKLLQLKANQYSRALKLTEVFPNIGTSSSLFNWYNRAIHINSQRVEPQANDGLAYVAGSITDDW